MHAMAKMVKNRQRLNWIPNVAPWRQAILAKIDRGLAIMAINVPASWRLAILAKIARGLAIQYLPAYKNLFFQI